MILITGHKGFIGSHLSKSFFVNYVGIDIQEGMNLLTCDLPKGVHTIFHLAAQSSVESSWHDPMHDMDNIRMIVRLVKEYPDARIIYANSCASINVNSPYGFSKKACADYLKKFHKDYVSLVFPNVYGGDSKSVVDLFHEKSDVTIFGDGLQVRDYVHVLDIVSGLRQAQNWGTGEYFMGSGRGTTVLELAKGKNIKYAPARKEDRGVIVPNTTPNWSPIINVLEYIK